MTSGLSKTSPFTFNFKKHCRISQCCAHSAGIQLGWKPVSLLCHSEITKKCTCLSSTDVLAPHITSCFITIDNNSYFHTHIAPIHVMVLQPLLLGWRSQLGGSRHLTHPEGEEAKWAMILSHACCLLGQEDNTTQAWATLMQNVKLYLPKK